MNQEETWWDTEKKGLRPRKRCFEKKIKQNLDYCAVQIVRALRSILGVEIDSVEKLNLQGPVLIRACDTNTCLGPSSQKKSGLLVGQSSLDPELGVLQKLRQVCVNNKHCSLLWMCLPLHYRWNALHAGGPSPSPSPSCGM